jgi:hypothetical protein
VHASDRLFFSLLLFRPLLLLIQAEAVETLPKWNFDGSSTNQAPGDDSEVILRPCRIFRDPFRPRSDGVSNVLVMCDTYTPSGEALETNFRAIGKFSLHHVDAFPLLRSRFWELIRSCRHLFLFRHFVVKLIRSCWAPMPAFRCSL